MAARWLATVAILVAACGTSPVVGVEVAGAIYTDVRWDAPCAEITQVPEIDGVVLRFTAPTGAVIGEAITGAIETEALAPSDGTAGWTHHGCRFIARYRVVLPVEDAYTVDFTAPPPRDPRAGTFIGVTDLQPLTASYEDLRSRGFEWSFEASPSYVVS